MAEQPRVGVRLRPCSCGAVQLSVAGGPWRCAVPCGAAELAGWTDADQWMFDRYCEGARP